TNLVPEFEAVRDCFGGVENAQCHPGDSVFPDAKMKRGPGHAREADEGQGNPGRPCFVADRHPYLAWRLRRQVVKAQGGQQADDPFRHLMRRFDQGSVLGCGEVLRGIETPRNPFEMSLPSKARQIGPRYAQFNRVPAFSTWRFVARRRSFSVLVRAILCLTASVSKTRQMSIN